MDRHTYFVPIDFSDYSYNALQYATMLASKTMSKVVLSHVIDSEEVPLSDNPAVVTWGLDKISRRVREKIESLREMISLTGISVQEEILVGQVENSLLKLIERIKPTVIVLGRSPQRQLQKSAIIASITRYAKVPVLVVPGSHHPRIPGRVALAADLKSFAFCDCESIIEILKNTSQELFVLNTRDYQSGSSELEWIGKFNAMYNMQAQVLPSADVEQVVDYINNNNIDLLCAVDRNYGLLENLLNPAQASKLASQVEVPVLLFKD
ncbi:MAG: universal stress protein [Cyclobacteriaceae bacterium]|nr:universal stress protein [Cyclobacteriaceae bacterium]